ncbi:MAG: hypothetical protein ACXVGR_15910 [Mycobacteriaceae bacterium]
MLHRHLVQADVVSGIEVALSVGATSADVVAVEARRAAEARKAHGPPTPKQNAEPMVTSLTERRLRGRCRVAGGGAGRTRVPQLRDGSGPIAE